MKSYEWMQQQIHKHFEKGTYEYVNKQMENWMDSLQNKVARGSGGGGPNATPGKLRKEASFFKTGKCKKKGCPALHDEKARQNYLSQTQCTDWDNPAAPGTKGDNGNKGGKGGKPPRRRSQSNGGKSDKGGKGDKGRRRSNSPSCPSDSSQKSACFAFSRGKCPYVNGDCPMARRPLIEKEVQIRDAWEAKLYRQGSLPYALPARKRGPELKKALAAEPDNTNRQNSPSAPSANAKAKAKAKGKAAAQRQRTPPPKQKKKDS